MDDTPSRCPHCQYPIPPTDQFCPQCGKPFDSRARALSAAIDAEISEAQGTPIKKAVGWMIALGVMFIVFGTAAGFIQRVEIEKARANLDSVASGMLVPVNGEMVTVDKLRSMLDFEEWSTFATNYLLAVFMFGLAFWARRSPFPAMLTALCLYLAVIVLNAILEPVTLVQGLLVKALFFAAMIAGIKAALEARRRTT